MVTTLIALSMLAGDGVSVKYLPSGASKGGYRPVLAPMTADAAGIKKAPTGLKSPQYGTLKFGDKSFAFILDEGGSSPALFIDSNHDGDLTNDPKIEWTGTKRGDFTLFMGGTTVDLGKGTPAAIKMYRFDPKDPQRAQLKSTLLYYPDFGYNVTLTLDGKEYSSPTSDLAHASLWVDRNGDGKQSNFHEMVSAGKPFNFTGTTYVLRADGEKLSLAKPDETVPLEPMAPNLANGQKVPAFTATTTDGQKVNFPADFKGKVVMLDFWATWCGPCMGEVPNVVKAYNTCRTKGFEILGISFDQANAADKVASVTKEKGMPWRQVYEGKFWDTTIGRQFDVASIPFALLVDGDTGTIIASGEELRGEGLTALIDKSIAKKLLAKGN